jgi:small subunit ribosomal protein S1
MIMAHDRDRGRLAFSTKKLEPAPGDMLKDPAKVFASAEDMAALFKIRVQAAEDAAREEEASLILQSQDTATDYGAGVGDGTGYY